MPFDPKSKNLAVWHREEPTDPAFVKAITGKQYKGSSPNPTYLVKRLTDAFGPVGWGWGYHVLAFEELVAGDGQVSQCHIRFWYFPGGRPIIEGVGQLQQVDVREMAGCAWFDQVGGTDFAGTRSSGKSYADEDARKKSLTDAIVKAASHIGFAADIFLGRWDDSKYVEAREQEERAATQAVKLDSKAELLARAQKIGDALGRAKNEAELTAQRSAAAAIRPALKNASLTDAINALGNAIKEAAARIGVDLAKAA